MQCYQHQVDIAPDSSIMAKGVIAPLPLILASRRIFFFVKNLLPKIENLGLDIPNLGKF